jgi:hypothetical protein
VDISLVFKASGGKHSTGKEGKEFLHVYEGVGGKVAQEIGLRLFFNTIDTISSAIITIAFLVVWGK